MTQRHRIELETEDIKALLRAVQSHAVVLRQGAEVLRSLKVDTPALARENDRLSHANSLIQLHDTRCDCPISIGVPQ